MYTHSSRHIDICNSISLFHSNKIVLLPFDQYEYINSENEDILDFKKHKKTKKQMFFFFSFFFF